MSEQQPEPEEVSKSDIFIRVQDLENPMTDTTTPTTPTLSANTRSLYMQVLDAKSLDEVKVIASQIPDKEARVAYNASRVLSQKGMTWSNAKMDQIANIPGVSFFMNVMGHEPATIANNGFFLGREVVLPLIRLIRGG